MFDAPVDAWYVWLGVAAVGVAALGVVTGMPTAAPPSATVVADAIDGVATGPPGSADVVSVDANEVRLDRRQVGLRGPGGTVHASVNFGPITPALADDRLERVLAGNRPTEEFQNASTFADAVAAARTNGTDWRPAPERIQIRRVTWEGVDVVLVG